MIILNKVRKLDWTRLTEDDLWHYKALTDENLSNINIPLDAILCGNISCKNQNHNTDLCAMYDTIVNCLNSGSKSFCQKRPKQQMSDPGGMNMCINSMQRQKKLLKTGCYLEKLGRVQNVN